METESETQDQTEKPALTGYPMPQRPVPFLHSVHLVTFYAKVNGKWLECFNNQWIPCREPPA